MFFYPEKEEKKKWKDMKLTKKLEKQRAQEEQTKLQKEEEEAAAQRENQGVWLSPGDGHKLWLQQLSCRQRRECHIWKSL